MTKLSDTIQIAEALIECFDEGNNWPQAKHIYQKIYGDDNNFLTRQIIKQIENYFSPARFYLVDELDIEVAPLCKNFYAYQKGRARFTVKPPMVDAEALLCLAYGSRPTVGIYRPNSENDLIFKNWIHLHGNKSGGRKYGKGQRRLIVAAEHGFIPLQAAQSVYVLGEHERQDELSNFSPDVIAKYHDSIIYGSPPPPKTHTRRALYYPSKAERKADEAKKRRAKKRRDQKKRPPEGEKASFMSDAGAES